MELQVSHGKLRLTLSVMSGIGGLLLGRSKHGAAYGIGKVILGGIVGEGQVQMSYEIGRAHV